MSRTRVAMASKMMRATRATIPRMIARMVILLMAWLASLVESKTAASREDLIHAQS